MWSVCCLRERRGEGGGATRTQARWLAEATTGIVGAVRVMVVVTGDGREGRLYVEGYGEMKETYGDCGCAVMGCVVDLTYRASHGILESVAGC